MKKIYDKFCSQDSDFESPRLETRISSPRGWREHVKLGIIDGQAIHLFSLMPTHAPTSLNTRDFKQVFGLRHTAHDLELKARKLRSGIQDSGQKYRTEPRSRPRALRSNTWTGALHHVSKFGSCGLAVETNSCNQRHRAASIYWTDGVTFEHVAIIYSTGGWH